MTVPGSISMISVRGMADTIDWGGMAFAVEENAAITLRQVNAIISSKIVVDGVEAYPNEEQALFRVEYTDGVGNRFAVNGGSFNDQYGFLGYRFLLVAADNSMIYTYYAEPLGDVAKDYSTNVGVTKTITTDSADVVTTTLPLGTMSAFAITAPVDAKVQMFTQTPGNYYGASEFPAFDTKDNGDGTKTVTFNGTGTGSATYRVSMEGKITKVAANVVINLIEAIGELKQDRKEAIQAAVNAARAAYDDLTDTQEVLVTNYARFVKNAISALDALLTYYIPGGGFRHVLDSNLDGMATEQAYYALVAYNRMLQNQNFLYDMTDVIDRGGDVIVEETTEPTEAPTEPVEEEMDDGNAIVIWMSVAAICAVAIVAVISSPMQTRQSSWTTAALLRMIHLETLVNCCGSRRTITYEDKKIQSGHAADLPDCHSSDAGSGKQAVRQILLYHQHTSHHRDFDPFLTGL